MTLPGIASFVGGVFLSLLAVIGGVSAITPSATSATSSIVSYDAP